MPTVRDIIGTFRKKHQYDTDRFLTRLGDVLFGDYWWERFCSTMYSKVLEPVGYVIWTTLYPVRVIFKVFGLAIMTALVLVVGLWPFFLVAFLTALFVKLL